MFEILSITGVIFVLVGVGFAMVRLGVFAAGDVAALGKFVVNLALPALIFRAVSAHPLSEIANPGYLGAYLFGSLAVFGLGYLWSRRLTGATPLGGTFDAMGMSCANSGFVGFPVALMALPDVASTALALNMIIENLVMIPLVLVLAEHARGGGMAGAALARQIGLRLVQSPIVIGLVLGLVVSASGLQLPTVVAKPVEVIAAASAAVSLTVIGGTLAGLPLRAVRLPVLGVVLGKLVLHPVAVALGLGLMALLGLGVGDAHLAAAAVVFASTPAMAVYPILAQRYGEARSASLAMFVMTAASFVTISVVLGVVLG